MKQARYVKILLLLCLFPLTSPRAEGTCVVKGWSKVGMDRYRKKDRAMVFRQIEPDWNSCKKWAKNDVLDDMIYWGKVRQREPGLGTVTYDMYARILRVEVWYWVDGKVNNEAEYPESWIQSWFED